MPKWLSYVLIAVAAYLLFFRRAFAGPGAAPIISPQRVPPAAPGDNTGRAIQVGGDLIGRLIDGAFSYSSDAGGSYPGGGSTATAPTANDDGSYSF